MNQTSEVIVFFAAIIALVIMLALLIKQRTKWRKIINNVQEENCNAIKRLQEKADKDVRSAQERADSEICSIRKETAQQIEEEKHKSEEALAAECKRSADALKAERERIAAEKAELLALSEKELMVQTVMALGGYGTRLDRIEEQRESLLQEIKTETMRILSEESANLLNALHEDINGLQKTVSSLKHEICEVGKSTTEAIESLHTTYDDSDLMSEITHIASSVSSLTSDVGEIKRDIESVTSDISTIHWDVSDIKSGIHD